MRYLTVILAALILISCSGNPTPPDPNNPAGSFIVDFQGEACRTLACTVTIIDVVESVTFQFFVDNQLQGIHTTLKGEARTAYQCDTGEIMAFRFLFMSHIEEYQVGDTWHFVIE